MLRKEIGRVVFCVMYTERSVHFVLNSRRWFVCVWYRDGCFPANSLLFTHIRTMHEFELITCRMGDQIHVIHFCFFRLKMFNIQLLHLIRIIVDSSLPSHFAISAYHTVFIIYSYGNRWISNSNLSANMNLIILFFRHTNLLSFYILISSFFLFIL